MAAIGAMLVAPAGATAATITFEELSTADHDTGPAAIVDDEYEGQGVTFAPVSAYDYSDTPGFAHSGTNAIEICPFASEFCIGKLVVTFTAPQDRVAIWAGFESSVTQPINLRLRAFGGPDLPLLGTDEVTLPATVGPAPVDNLLVVDLPNPAIERIEVDVTNNSNIADGVVLDDLEFSAVGQPPPCLATAPPAITITQPVSGDSVHFDSFVFSGSAEDNGAANSLGAITGATVTSVSAAGVRSAQVFPGLIDADGGTFGPTNFNGLLAEGKNDIVVSATNCAGSGTSAPVQVVYEPIQSSTIFQQLGAIEVNQTIQNPGNGVPLIASGPNGVKRTFARAFLTLSGGSSGISDVRGRLTATRPDGSLPPGPVSIPSLNSIRVRSATSRQVVRSSLADSLNFELPPEWLGAGRLHLEISKLYIEGRESPFACERCANRGFFGPRFVRFRRVTPLHVWIVKAPYRLGGGVISGRQVGGSPLAPITPSRFDIDMFKSWVRRAFPASDVRFTEASLRTKNLPYEDCHEVNSRLVPFALNAIFGGRANGRTRFIGMVDDNDYNNFLGACVLYSQPGQHIGSAASGAPTSTFAAWDDDGSYADAYVAHELGHTFNRFHPGFCHGQDEGDPDFPYPGGLVGSSQFDNVGLDVGDAALGLSPQLYDWRAGAHDFMSYCNDQWPSHYSYRAILEGMCAEAPGGCELDSLPAADSSGRAGGSPTKRARLSVRAKLRPRAGQVKLEELTMLRGIPLTVRPKRSRYRIELRGPEGEVLAVHPFRPRRIGEPELGDTGTARGREAFINEVVPFEAQTRRVVILGAGRELAAFGVSRNRPEVQIIAPAGGEVVTDAVTVQWRATDKDGPVRRYSLLYAADGTDFQPIATGLRRRSFTVDLAELPGGPAARFRVVASDGVRTGIATSKPVSVPVRAPRVLISAPAGGATVPANEPVSLVASAEDLLGEVISGESVVWSSSLQGELGRGLAISASLIPGTHLITATASNSLGAAGSQSVTVEVPAPPTSFDAGGG